MSSSRRFSCPPRLAHAARHSGSDDGHKLVSFRTSDLPDHQSLRRPGFVPPSRPVGRSFSMVIPSPHPFALKERVVFCPNPAKKNIIITANGYEHNVTEYRQVLINEGVIAEVETDKYAPGNYSFLSHLAGMSVLERARFWARNEVQIIITTADIGTPESKAEDVISNIRQLGSSFYDNVERVHVDLVFAAPLQATSEVIRHKGLKFMLMPRQLNNIRIQSPSTLYITRFLCHLQRIKSLKHLTVTLQTPHSAQGPLTSHNLDLVVPFMSLTDWDLLWKPIYSEGAQQVPAKGWVTRYLKAQWKSIRKDFAKEWASIEAGEFPAPIGDWELANGLD